MLQRLLAKVPAPKATRPRISLAAQALAVRKRFLQRRIGHGREGRGHGLFIIVREPAENAEVQIGPGQWPREVLTDLSDRGRDGLGIADVALLAIGERRVRANDIDVGVQGIAIVERVPVGPSRLFEPEKLAVEVCDQVIPFETRVRAQGVEGEGLGARGLQARAARSDSLSATRSRPRSFK
jgi:hypothetical protein